MSAKSTSGLITLLPPQLLLLHGVLKNEVRFETTWSTGFQPDTISWQFAADNHPNQLDQLELTLVRKCGM